jgi:hypothetical protein
MKLGVGMTAQVTVDDVVDSMAVGDRAVVAKAFLPTQSQEAEAIPIVIAVS